MSELDSRGYSYYVVYVWCLCDDIQATALEIDTRASKVKSKCMLRLQSVQTPTNVHV